MCTTASHEALKRNTNQLHSECTYLGEQKDEGYPTLLLFNHSCGSTIAMPAIAQCERCVRTDIVNGLCSAHGADCWACDRRFEPRELCGGVCGECANDDDACDNLGAPLPAMGAR